MTRLYATDATPDAVFAASFPESDASSEREGLAVSPIAPAIREGARSAGSTILSVLGTLGLVLLVPLYVFALPIVLLWRLLLDTLVWRRPTPWDDSASDRASLEALELPPW